jgi:hypothetical protein
MKDMKQQNTVNLGNFYLSNQCESAQSVVKSQSIKNNKLCKTNPISEMPKMNLTNYMTKDYVNNLRLLKMEKQSQTKPILSASGGFIQTPRIWCVCLMPFGTTAGPFSLGKAEP